MIPLPSKTALPKFNNTRLHNRVCACASAQMITANERTSLPGICEGLVFFFARSGPPTRTARSSISFPRSRVVASSASAWGGRTRGMGHNLTLFAGVYEPHDISCHARNRKVPLLPRLLDPLSALPGRQCRKKKRGGSVRALVTAVRCRLAFHGIDSREDRLYGTCWSPSPAYCRRSFGDDGT